MADSYMTAARLGEAEYTDKKSRFIGHVQSVASEEEARAFISSVKAKYADATHNVWAYTLRNGTVRWSDDGEPGGTSGQPTLSVLKGSGLEDICCVTTRYFGGILLGSGGLVRAYSTAARLAVQAAGVKRFSPWSCGILQCPYSLYDRLCRALTDRGSRIEESSFAEQVEIIFSVPQGIESTVERCVTELSAGSVVPEFRCTVMRGVEE